MQVIPSQIFKKTSPAEIRIHNYLQQIQLSDYDVALHSLNLGDSEYKKWCEADFIIISTFIIFL